MRWKLSTATQLAVVLVHCTPMVTSWVVVFMKRTEKCWGFSSAVAMARVLLPMKRETPFIFTVSSGFQVAMTSASKR